jgi:hypothetical protein
MNLVSVHMKERETFKDFNFKFMKSLSKIS